MDHRIAATTARTQLQQDAANLTVREFLQSATWSDYECDSRTFEVLADACKNDKSHTLSIDGLHLNITVPSHFDVAVVNCVYFVRYYKGHRGNRGSGVYMSERKATYLFAGAD